MKLAELRITIPGNPPVPIDARDIELSVDEFKELIGLMEQFSSLQLELEKLRVARSR